jgi:hypothetical protein
MAPSRTASNQPWSLASTNIVRTASNRPPPPADDRGGAIGAEAVDVDGASSVMPRSASQSSPPLPLPLPLPPLPPLAPPALLPVMHVHHVPLQFLTHTLRHRRHCHRESGQRRRHRPLQVAEARPPSSTMRQGAASARA